MLPVIFPFPSPLAFALNKSRLKRSPCLRFSRIPWYFLIIIFALFHGGRACMCVVYAFIWQCLQFGSLYRIQYISIISVCGIYASIYVMALHNKYTFGIVRSTIHIIHLTSCFPNLSHPFPAWLCARSPAFVALSLARVCAGDAASRIMAKINAEKHIKIYIPNIGECTI